MMDTREMHNLFSQILVKTPLAIVMQIVLIHIHRPNKMSGEKKTEYFKIILTEYDGQTRDAYSVKFW